MVEGKRQQRGWGKKKKQLNKTKNLCATKPVCNLVTLAAREVLLKKIWPGISSEYMNN